VTLEFGTDRLSRNIGTELPLYALGNKPKKRSFQGTGFLYDKIDTTQEQGAVHSIWCITGRYQDFNLALMWTITFQSHNNIARDTGHKILMSAHPFR
jgi:hypothetical protein